MAVPAQLSPTSESEQQSDIGQADLFLAHILSGAGPASLTLPDDPGLLPGRALYHGVSALLAARRDIMESLPPAVQDEIQAHALNETMWDLRHRQLLVPLLEDLAQQGIPAVLLKGTALAYGLYPSPALRQRGDTDLLVPASRASEVWSSMKRHGFQRIGGDGLTVSGPGVERQEAWCHGRDQATHVIELHWQVMNSWALTDVLEANELLQNGQPLPQLSPKALRLPDPKALLHAIFHRARHFNSVYFIKGELTYDGDRLIWLYDIDLLARRMTAADWKLFGSDAKATQTAKICLDALETCRRLFGTPLPDHVALQLAELAPQRGPAHDYLVGSSLAGRVWSDARALPTVSARLGYLRRVLFPPASVMRAAYPQLANRHLFELYIYRFIERLRRLQKARRQRRQRS